MTETETKTKKANWVARKCLGCGKHNKFHRVTCRKCGARLLTRDQDFQYIVSARSQKAG